MNATAALVAYQLASLILLIVNGGVLIWIAITLKNAPGNSINVRAILGCIEAVRVQIASVARTEENNADAIMTQLNGIISMIDVYILRISGVPTGSKPPKSSIA
jgi:hypothetical protein